MVLKTLSLDLRVQKDFPIGLKERIKEDYNLYYLEGNFFDYYPYLNNIKGLNEWLSNNGLQVNTNDKYFLYSYLY